MSPPVTNKKRAAWAQAGLAAYAAAKEGTRLLQEDAETVFGDMLADLMHFAAQSGFDMDEHIERARGHYEAENAEEGGAA